MPLIYVQINQWRSKKERVKCKYVLLNKQTSARAEKYCIVGILFFC